MRLYELFIDELGIPNPVTSHSDVYVLCGCAVEKMDRDEIKISADQIKFKYWNKTDIVFHSREIGKKEGDFSIFKKNTRLRKEFFTDLYMFLKSCNISTFVIVIDKDKAKKEGWNSVKVIKETARKLFYQYITWLLGLGNAKGKICIESATAEKDRYYLNEFSYFLSPGCKELTVDYKVIQDIFTSIAFVTKRNHDIEEQIADLFAYAARCKFMRIMGKETYKVGTYEDRIIRILEGKLFKKPIKANKNKMKYYNAIDPFCTLP